MSIGTIVACTAYLTALYGLLRETLAGVPVDAAASLVSFERVFEAVDEAPDVTELRSARQIGMGSGQIEFQNVFFAYHGVESPAICVGASGQ